MSKSGSCDSGCAYCSRENNSQIFPGMLYRDLPKALQLSISAYYEFWHDLPGDMRLPSDKDIELYVNEHY